MHKIVSKKNTKPVDKDSEIRIQLEKMVDSYDSYMKRVTSGREDKLREITVSLAQVKLGDSILEVGCGTGTLTLEAKRQAGASGRVSGIDIIPGMLDVCRQKALNAGLDVDFELGSIDSIPFSDNEFDVVLCSFMIFHMSEGVRRKGIKEIFRILKPNGRLTVIDLSLPVNPIPKAFVKLFLGFMIQHDLKELLPLMEADGFTGTELGQVGFRVMGMPVLSFVRGVKP